MIQPNAIGISARSDAMVDECRPFAWSVIADDAEMRAAMVAAVGD
jgi:hypothetical protein